MRSPVSVGSLRESEAIGELLLRKACLLTERVQTLAERGAFAFGRSTCFHERSIRRKSVVRDLRRRCAKSFSPRFFSLSDICNSRPVLLPATVNTVRK